MENTKMETMETAMATPDPGTMPSNGLITRVANVINCLYRTRQSLGLSIKEVAEKVDITPAFLKKIESYRAVPRLDTVFKLCELYGLALNIYHSSEDVAQ